MRDIRTTVYNVQGTDILVTARLDKSLLSRVILAKLLQADIDKRSAVRLVNTEGKLVS